MSSKENSGIPLNLVQDASDESVGYTPHGYSLLDEVFLECPSCSKKMVSIILVKKDNSPETIFKAKCPKCKVNSFTKKISGYKVYYKAVDPFKLDEEDIYDNKCEFKLK